MLQTHISSHRVVAYRPSLRLDGALGSRLLPFWCDVRETAWTMRMRSQVAAVTFVGVRGSQRAWHFSLTENLGGHGCRHGNGEADISTSGFQARYV